MSAHAHTLLLLLVRLCVRAVSRTQAAKRRQLEQALQQMRCDLQQAAQLLEQTTGTSQQQAQLNGELQEQLQQVSVKCHTPLVPIPCTNSSAAALFCWCSIP